MAGIITIPTPDCGAICRLDRKWEDESQRVHVRRQRPGLFRCGWIMDMAIDKYSQYSDDNLGAVGQRGGNLFPNGVDILL